MKISFTHPGRTDVRLDSEKYSWAVDRDIGNLEIFSKETHKLVGTYVAGTWWSVVDFEDEPKTTTNYNAKDQIFNPMTTGTTGYIIQPNQAL